MKKNKKVIIIILLIILIPIVGIPLTAWIYIQPPMVKFNEKKNVANYVEKYLTEKYGKHNFKVTGVKYEFNSTTLFDYSDPEGYNVQFKCDIVRRAFVYIDGIDNYKVTGDSLISEYYFPNLDGYKRYEKLESITPVEKIEASLLEKIKDEFEPSCQSVKHNNSKLNVPNDFGRIPTMDEIENDLNLYEILDFNYTHTNTIENEEDYEKKLSEYLNKKFNGNWNIYFNPNGSITCIKD